jgi:hypothetical protein
MFIAHLRLSTIHSGPDGTISHKTSGIHIGQTGFNDGHEEFYMDPRDVEVCKYIGDI